MPTLPLRELSQLREHDTLSVTFTPTDTTNYTTATKTVQITVTQAAPVITWANPASIVYGTALSATQLNATASVAGSFAYTPAAGSIPAAGTDTLSVTFTPTDSTDYTQRHQDGTDHRHTGHSCYHVGSSVEHHLRDGTIRGAVECDCLSTWFVRLHSGRR